MATDDPGRRVAVISGGGTGIGAATARRFIADGYFVSVLGRRVEPLTALADEIGVLPLVADAASPAEVLAALEETLAHFGRIDVIVANAGGGGLHTVGGTSDEEWDAALRSNVTTAFTLIREALPALLQSRGSIVMVASLASFFAGPSVAGYTVGKHALVGLTRSLARDYGPHGIRVNAVCPGWVRTDMGDAEMEPLIATGLAADRDAAYALVTANVPLGRVAEAAEVAAIVRFLASNEAAIITGETIFADGGAHVVDVPTISMSQL